MIDPAAADAIVAALPPHFSGLTIEHNPHRASYMMAAEWLAAVGEEPDWRTPEAMARAVAAEDFWTMRWHPDTPVGSLYIAAPTLAELLAYAAE